MSALTAADRTDLTDPYSFTIDPLQFAPGGNTVTVGVTNAAGVSAEQTFPFDVAALPPQIIVTGLQDGQAVDAPVDFTVSVTAQEPGTQLNVKVGDLALQPTNATYTIDPMICRRARMR